MKKLITTSAILASAVALSACQSTPATQSTVNNNNVVQPALKAQIHSTDASQTHIGDMYLRQAADGVQVYGELAGITPGETVAIHIHENGSCDNSGKGAGGHFNPFNQPHGVPTEAASHAGDLPNITADANGVAALNFTKKGISIAETGDNSVYNRAFIVHAGSDDYKSQPSGDAGDRMACGIIKKL